MNRRRGVRIALVAVVVFAVLGARVDGSAQAPASTGPITIGVLAPSTGPFATYAQRVNLDAALRHETILVGSPERVRDQIARLLESTGANYVIGCFAWGDLTQEQSLRSLRLFAEQVMPAFQRRTP